MSEKNTGGPAFPSEQHETQNGDWNQSYDPGMTLRDYFAAKAMQADYAAIMQKGQCALYADIAGRAYIVADAMLKAREA